MVGTVHDLFGLASESQGWIEIQADLAVAALGILSADIPEQEQSGLACVGCRPASEQPHLVHYATADPWWTQFCFANPQVDTVSMALRLFGNDGVPQGAPYLGLASRGGLALRAEELLPTHGRIW